MILQDVYLPEFIKFNMEAEDKDEAFEELVDYYCQVNNSDAHNEILDAIVTREAKMSTGIHKGIAVPHGKTNALDDIYGIIGISRKGIDYDALDGQPVYLLFMLLAPQKDSEMHLRLLKRLAALLDNPQFYAELIDQADASGVQRIIKKFEEIFISA